MKNLAVELANILTDYSSPVQPGEYVTIVGNPAVAGPLVEALLEAVLRRGAHPNVQAAALVSPDYTSYFELFMRLANDDQLDHLDPTMMQWVEHSDALFFVKATGNAKELSAIDPARVSRFRKAQQPFSNRYLERYAEKTLRWTVVGWPTQAAAQAADMSLGDYTDFVARACGLDQPDPVAYWREFRLMQERLVAWLSDKSHVEVRGPGVNLSFEYAQRPWVSCHGMLNFPDGEVFTSPVENTMNGTIEFNFPCVYQGNEVDGVKLRFKDGVAVEASATKNEAYLVKMLDTDEGARRLGEFAIGTNHGVTRMTRNILFDEKIGSSIHMALGRGYEESHGVNQSAIHWDMIHSMKDGGEIFVDGTLFYRSGEFMVK